ncbi:MAG: DUF1697 domain-containing protein [Gemmatimonadaceae bacterium]
MSPRKSAAGLTRYIAFLRAINVGGHVVKMDALRTHFESLRLANVETFIASGNVIFDAPTGGATSLEEEIEHQLAKKLGYEVATFLRAPTELAAVVAQQPFGATDPLDDGHTLSVGFVKSAPSSAALTKLQAHVSEIDDFRIVGREVFWLCRTRTSDSKFSGARLEKLLASPATFRNVTTVRKLAAKYQAK